MLCEPANWKRKVIAGREGGKKREKEVAMMRSLRVLERIDFLELFALYFPPVYFSATHLPISHTSAMILCLWGSGSRHLETALELLCNKK